MAATALIVYYSRTGHTAALAGRLGEALDAQVERLEPLPRRPRSRFAPRAGWFSRVWARVETWTGRARAIRPVRFSPADYAVVLIGCPVWAGRVPPPVRQWICDHRDDLPPHVGFFASCTDDRAETMYSDLARRCNRPPLATMTVPQRWHGTENEDNLLVRFAMRLAPALARRSAAAVHV